MAGTVPITTIYEVRGFILFNKKEGNVVGNPAAGLWISGGHGRGIFQGIPAVISPC